MPNVLPDPETYTTVFFKADTDRGVLLKDLTTDNVVTALIQLGAEVWGYRRRMMIMEQLLEEKGKVTKELIEQYVPSTALMVEWEGERDAFVRRIYDVLARQGDVPVNAKMDYSEQEAESDEDVINQFHYY
jgi:hypothetical protein